MLSKKGGRGFPHCVIMDQTGKVLSSNARPMEEEPFKAALRPAQILMAARLEVAKKATAEAKRNLALIEAVFEPNERELKKLVKASKKSDVNPEIKALFEDMIKTYPARKVVDEAEKAVANGKSNDDAQAESAKKMYELLAQKFMVEDEKSDYFDPFWLGVANHSITVKDKKTGIAAVEMLEKKYKDNARAMNFIGNLRQKVEAL